LHGVACGPATTEVEAEAHRTDGPFTPTNEQLAGFWLIQVESKQRAIDWASRVPFTDGEEVDVRWYSRRHCPHTNERISWRVASRLDASLPRFRRRRLEA
jgi:hypothetical protein